MTWLSSCEYAMEILRKNSFDIDDLEVNEWVSRWMKRFEEG